MKKTAVIISILLSGSVLIVCSIMAIGYWRRPDQVKNIGDWITDDTDSGSPGGVNSWVCRLKMQI